MKQEIKNKLLELNNHSIELNAKIHALLEHPDAGTPGALTVR